MTKKSNTIHGKINTQFMENIAKISYGSFVVSLVILAIKYAAYLVTGSVALYSDALESIINVATAIAAIIAIRIAAAPPDVEHPYGHHKAEYLSAIIVGALIIVAAFAIFHEAYLGWLNPKPIETPWAGLAISLGATILNAAWSGVLIRAGRVQRSAALKADGKHLLVDVVTSLGVLVGVILVIATGIIVLDSVIAALVALHVLWSGWGVVRENSSSLLDEAAPEEELQQIRKIISANASPALEAHALRTRHAGKVTFVDFHLVVDGSISVFASHEICDQIEAAIKTEVPGALVTIHVEPEHKAKHTGVVVL